MSGFAVPKRELALFKSAFISKKEQEAERAAASRKAGLEKYKALT